GGRSASRVIPFAEIAQEGFEEKDGALFLTGEAGFLHIPLDGRYVENFVYSYEYEGLLNAAVSVGVRNAYGEVRERDVMSMQDRNSRVLNRSFIPVRAEAEYVDLYVTRDGLREPGLSYLDFDAWPLSFTGFETTSAPAVNWYRLCFFWCGAALAAALIFFRDAFAKKMEVGFLIISLTLGTLLSLSLPANKVGWDEEVHFAQTFWLSNYRSPVQLSSAILQEFVAGIDTWPYNQPGSGEEQEALEAYLDEAGDYRTGEQLWSADLNQATVTGYVGQAALLKAGQLLHLPFSVLFKLGRLGNLWIYC
ncbi:MAG: hypothetical protein Q4F75_08445, partial [Pseudomonadota bacterium]|nr:hypothetical protein [Pseudomonadota bacterium]